MAGLFRDLYFIITLLSVTCEVYQSNYSYSDYLGGTCRFEDFKIGREIGSGSDAIVRKARHTPSGHVVALKFFNDPNDRRREIKREEEILHELDSSKIAKHYCTMSGKHGEGVVFVLELITGKTLQSTLKGHSRQKINVRKIIQQLVDVLQYLKRQRVVWGDLACDNIILDEQQRIKLIDFGDAVKVHKRKQESAHSISWGQTRPYLWQNYKSDWYSLGLLVFEMLYSINQDHWVPQHKVYKKDCYKLLGKPQYDACDLINYLRDCIWHKGEISMKQIEENSWLND